MTLLERISKSGLALAMMVVEKIMIDMWLLKARQNYVDGKDCKNVFYYEHNNFIKIKITSNNSGNESKSYTPDSGSRGIGGRSEGSECEYKKKLTTRHLKEVPIECGIIWLREMDDGI